MIFPLFALLLLLGCNNTTIYCSNSSEYRPAQPSSPFPSDSSSLDTTPPLPSFPKPAFLMTEVDLKTLDGSARLNDEVLNYYLQLKASESPGVYVFNTFFYPRLKAKGYEHVKGWTKYVDLFAYRLVLFPIHHEQGKHWSLVAAEMQSKTLYYFDSAYKDKHAVVKAICDYLSDEHKARKGQGIEFQQAMFPGEIPKQTNDYDCGVFVLKYAMEIIAAADPLKLLKFSFEQKDTQNIRQAIKNEIDHSSKSANKTRTNTTTNTVTARKIGVEEYHTEDVMVKRTTPLFSDLSVLNDTPDNSVKISKLTVKNQVKVQNLYNMDFGTPLNTSFSENQQPTTNSMEPKKRKLVAFDSPNKRPKGDSQDQSNSVSHPIVTPSAFAFVSHRLSPDQTPPPNNSKQPIPVNYNPSTGTFSPTFSIPPLVTYKSSVPTYGQTSAIPIAVKPSGGPSSQTSIITCPPPIPVRPAQASTNAYLLLPVINPQATITPFMGNYSNTSTAGGIPPTPKPLVQPPQYNSPTAPNTSVGQNLTLSNSYTFL